MGPPSTRAVVAVSPEVIFRDINTEIRLTFGPAPGVPVGSVAARAAGATTFLPAASYAPNGLLASPGDLVAIRTTQQIIDTNCSFVRPEEVQRISATGTILSGALNNGINEYHLCVGNASEIGLEPRADLGGVWPSNFSQQYLVRLSVVDVLNVGGGHQVGVFTNQGVALRATTQDLPGVAPATRSGAINMQPPRLPTQLLLVGPKPGSTEVRGVPFLQQPVVKVIGADGRLFSDVTGSVRLAAFGGCTPALSGQTKADLVDGVATFTLVTLSTIGCLGEDVSLFAQVCIHSSAAD